MTISPSTICRELKRNTDPTLNTLYSSRRAETIARERRRRAAVNNAAIELSIDALSFVRQQLALHTSPEVISGRLKKLFGIAVSKNTLYRYIRNDRLAGGKSYRYDSGDPKRSPIPDRIGIEHRPAEAELKQFPGHFEIDTIFGKEQKSFLLTVVDKATKQVIIRKLANKRAESVVAAFHDIVAKTFCEFKTLTADNGSEFAQHKQISEITGASVYFARPYHSWERGLNEHTNGLIRRFYPKGTDFSCVSDSEIAKL